MLMHQISSQSVYSVALWCQKNSFQLWHFVMSPIGGIQSKLNAGANPIQHQQQQQPFNGPLSETTRVRWYQKGKTNLDLLEQEIVSGSVISWAICCTSPQTDNHTSTPPLTFYKLDALPATQLTASKHWMQVQTLSNGVKIISIFQSLQSKVVLIKMFHFSTDTLIAGKIADIKLVKITRSTLRNLCLLVIFVHITLP